MHALRRAASPTANPVGADHVGGASLRLDDLRAPGLLGALFSTTLIAMTALPAIASSDTTSPAPTTTAAAPVATKASSSLTVDSVRRTVIAGRRLVVRGALRPAGAGRAVSLQLARTGGGWTTVDHDRTDAKGRYVLAWRATHTGTKRVRVHFGGTRELTSARHLAGTARVYRPAVAPLDRPGPYRP